MKVIRDRNGRLLAGSSSLNPGGRPKTPEHIKEMLEGLTEKAVLALEEALDGDDAKLKLTAAQEVLNRALGKPHTTASIDLKAVDLGAAHVAALVSLTALAASPRAPSVVSDVVTIDATPQSAAPLAIESTAERD